MRTGGRRRRSVTRIMLELSIGGAPAARPARAGSRFEARNCAPRTGYRTIRGGLQPGGQIGTAGMIRPENPPLSSRCVDFG